MRALVFRPEALGHRVAGWLGAAGPSPASRLNPGLRLDDVSAPVVPGPGWLRLKVLRSSLGPMERAQLSGSIKPDDSVSGLRSCVPGAEILGEVVEVRRPDTSGGQPLFEVGARVLVDPYLSCAARGFAHQPCGACTQGQLWACRRAGEPGALELRGEALAPGRRLGAHSQLPGGWAQEVVAHESQLVPVHPSLSHRAAILAASIAQMLAPLAWLLGRQDDRARGPLLLLGEDASLMAALRVLQAMSYPGEVITGSSPAMSGVAKALGATRIPEDEEGLRKLKIGALLSVSADPALEDRVLEQLASGGRIARVAPMRSPPSLEGPSESRVFQGFSAPVSGPDGGETALSLAHRLVLASPSPLEEAVTHVYPLDQFRRAWGTAQGTGGDAAGRVLLDPGLS